MRLTRVNSPIRTCGWRCSFLGHRGSSREEMQFNCQQQSETIVIYAARQKGAKRKADRASLPQALLRGAWIVMHGSEAARTQLQTSGQTPTLPKSRERVRHVINTTERKQNKVAAHTWQGECEPRCTRRSKQPRRADLATPNNFRRRAAPTSGCSVTHIRDVHPSPKYNVASQRPVSQV